MKIYAPVTDVNGIYASVVFTNGVGETDNPHLIEWFKSRGYTVEESNSIIYVENDGNEPLNDVIKMVDEIVEPDFYAMTPNELRDWMKENGFGSKIKNIRNKEKLIEIIMGGE